MIDTNKYEGHTPAPWDGILSGYFTIEQLKGIDKTLMQDAPLLLAEVKRLREVISRAINTLLPNPPQDLYELSSTTFAQDIGDLIEFYTQAMGHAIGILEGTE